MTALQGGPAAPVYLINPATGAPFSSASGQPMQIAGPLDRKADAASVSVALSIEDVAIINRIPAQGAAALAASEPINETSATLYAGTASLTTGAAAIASTQAIREVLVQNDPDNVVDVFVGSASAQPIQLKPGWSVTIPVSDLATVWAKSASGTPTLNYLGRS